MPSVYAVVGGPNTHKTSSIRALTGVWRRERNWHIAYVDAGSIDTYVEPRGLQENNISPQEFIGEVNQSGATRIVVALRYSEMGEHPDAIEYLNAFVAAGWDVVRHAVLGQQDTLQGFGVGIAVPDAADIPSNEVAARLRKTFEIR